ncbi:membrane progestin receptor gamma-like [Sycon ciliatum]|uniref:membrane progestin receptor gamma-like n=1 Tax=Sycon ciliatum TaxID=27933 RepID=UPI0031F68807
MGILETATNWIRFVAGATQAQLPSHGSDLSVDQCDRIPFIRKGYRHANTVSESILSCFTLSNEAANIWSHGVSSLVYIGLLCESLREACGGESGQHVHLIREQYVPLLLQMFGVWVCVTCSCLAHIFGCVSRWHCRAMFILDYFGINFSTTASALALYAYTRPMDPGTGNFATFSMRAFFSIALASHLSVFTMQCCMNFVFRPAEHIKVIVVAAFTASFSVNALPLLSRYLSGETQPSDLYHCLHLACSALGGLCLATHLPERLAPDCFYVLHSHSLMHIGTVVGAYYQGLALQLDMPRWRELPSRPSLANMACVMAVYTVSAGLLGYWIAYGKLKTVDRGDQDRTTFKTASAKKIR